MTTSFTLKTLTLVTALTIISTLIYPNIEETVELNIEPLIQITNTDLQRLNNTELHNHESNLVELTSLLPMEIEQLEPEIFEYIVYTEEAIPVMAESINITHITSNCGWSCRGGCGSYYLIETIEEIPIEEEEESLLSEQILVDPYLFEAKAYPNPTRDNTTIELDIELGGNFTIQLFDMNGRLVQQIYDGHLESGRQSFNADLFEYMPGLYFISIQSLFQQETLKIQKID